LLSSLIGPVAPQTEAATDTFAEPIDAVSFGLPGADESLEVSYKDAGGAWSEWRTLTLENEQDPSLSETNLLMLPEGVTELRVQGADDGYVAHPIRVAKGPARVEVAATTAMATPKILSRAQWGADDSLLFEAPDAASAETNVSAGDNGAATATSSQRIRDCQDAQKNYPEQFETQGTVTKDAAGRKYHWPLSYSKEVHLLVAHHTALYVSDDSRDPAERMRALYQYHAENRGWGDIGYNYVIDEKGQIYEGRTGGRNVVAGHAYCNNVGTIGISLMGNFDLEQPSQSQVQSLQWLLKELSDTYGINPNNGVEHHGKKFVTPFVGHRDLVSTDCPGYYMYGAMGQVTANVRAGNLDGVVKFPVVAKKPVSSSSSSASAPIARGITKTSEGLEAVGRTGLSLAPGAKQRISLVYTAPQTGVHANGRIAQVALSTPDILLFQEDGGKQIPVKTSLSSQYDVPGGETLSISLLIQAPWNTGNYWFEIGGIKYTLTASGRRSRVETYANPFDKQPAVSSSSSASIRKVIRPPVSQPSSVPRVSSSRASSVPKYVEPANTSLTRVRLSASAAPSVTFENGGMIGNQRVASGDKIRLTAKDNSCRAQATGVDTSAAVLTLKPSAGVGSVDAVNGKVRRYRGTLECRVIDGQVVVINELPLEDYMRGLAEEPDTEPYEKQRAFAVAARTYMAYWMQSEHRKFPGMPYDGSDSPATFQAYGGYDLETANPFWVKAVNATNASIMTYNGQIVRPPYFSSDDGKTRTPEQAGWTNFPFSQELFRAKDDPWCKGMAMAGHGVGMSGCGAEGQANEGKSAEQILQYYYPGVILRPLK
jgi:hypothetical protein